MTKHVPAAFREVLAAELPGWRADGVIDEAASQALIRRYALDHVIEPGRSWAASAFAILGALAIGAGIVTFVAANWAAIDSFTRFAIVFGATTAAYAVGFALRARGRGPLSEAAFVCAALGFGGSIALGAQQYNFSLSLWQVYALWAAGLVPLALALRSKSVAMVALAAGAISLATHVFEMRGDASANALLLHLGIIAALGVLLSTRLGALWFRELLIAVVASGMVFVILPTAQDSRATLIALIAAVTLAAGAARSQPLRLAGIVIAIVAAVPSTFWWAYPNWGKNGPLEPVALLLLAAAAASAVRVHGRAVLTYLPVWIAVAVVILLPHVGGIAPLTGVLIANALVIISATLLIVRGVALRNRSEFMYGTAACALDGFLRFAEYDHNLTAKALAFVIVGLAFTGAALLFERSARSERPAHAA